MDAPIVTVDSVDHETISKNIPTSVIIFRFDVDVVQWVVCSGGNAPYQGKVLDKGSGCKSNQPITVGIDWSKLLEGSNRINIYGMDGGGNWTPYGDNRLPGSSNTVTIQVYGQIMYGQSILGGGD